MMEMEFVDYVCSERIGFITLNRPVKRNALNFKVVKELKAAFAEAGSDPSVKVIVLKAEGSAFCAGADLEYLKQLQANSYEENLEDSNHLKELFHMIYTIEKVVIAQVQGHAIAGGCGLASVCDFAFSVPEARFGYTEVKIGFVPAIVMFFLIRKLGEARARTLLLSGELISAELAKEYGILYEVVPSDALAETVLKFAQNLIENNAPQSMALTKKMIAEIQSKDMDAGLNYAAEMNASARATADCQRGIAAFLEKKEIKW